MPHYTFKSCLRPVLLGCGLKKSQLLTMKRPRGRPMSKEPKVFTAIRLDADLLATFKATGKGWQTRVNAALRQYVAAHPLDPVGR